MLAHATLQKGFWDQIRIGETPDNNFLYWRERHLSNLSELS